MTITSGSLGHYTTQAENSAVVIELAAATRLAIFFLVGTDRVIESTGMKVPALDCTAESLRCSLLDGC